MLLWEFQYACSPYAMNQASMDCVLIAQCSLLPVQPITVGLMSSLHAAPGVVQYACIELDINGIVRSQPSVQRSVQHIGLSFTQASLLLIALLTS